MYMMAAVSERIGTSTGHAKTEFLAQRRFVHLRGTEGRNKRQEEKGGGGGGRDVCPRGTKGCLWREGRQMWHIGKWKFIKEKGETPGQHEIG